MNTLFQSATPETGLKNLQPAKKKVLLMNDDPVTRKIFHRLLTEEGYCAMPAANCAEALEFAATAQFDLMLLDFLVLKKAT